MKPAKILIISTLFIFLTSCGVISDINKSEETQSSEESKTVETYVLINAMMEQARQNYVDALKYQKLGFKKEAIESYENALKRLIN